MKRMILGVLAVLACSGDAWAGGWKVTVEPQYRVGMSMDLNGSSYANQPSSAALFPGRNSRSAMNWTYAPRPDSSIVQPPTDDITQFRDRFFDDGYVGPCDSTTEFNPYTWYWGWDDAGQYDADMQTLTFTRESGTSSRGTYLDTAVGTEYRSQTTVLMDEELSGHKSFSAAGLELAARYTVLEKDTHALEFSIGLAGWWGEKINFNEQTFAAHVREDRYAVYGVRNYAYEYSGSYIETYVYDDPGSTVPLTTPPYDHGYDFDEEGSNPSINALPSVREVSQTGGTSFNRETGAATLHDYAGGQSWAVANAVQVGADVNNAALRLGAAGSWKASERIRVFAQPLVSLNCVQADLERREQLNVTDGAGRTSVLREWRDRASENKWIVGLGVKGGVNVDLGGQWFVECAAGYEWMTQKPEFDIGPSTVKMDLSAFEISAGVGRAL